MVVDQASDALGEVLQGLRLVDSCYCRTELSAPWGLDMAECPNLVFHFVAEGECWLESSAGLRRLTAGDLVVFPRGARHRLLGAPEVPPGWVLGLPVVGSAPQTASYISHGGGGGERALVLCGGASFDPPDQPLVSLLPELLAVSEDGGWVGSTLTVMGLEAAAPRPGGETVIARLCDIVVIHAIREWLATSPDAQHGWLGALRDPHVGRVLALVHAAPEQPFTVATLAAAAHMSRAAFAERFTRLVGVAPMEYVTRRRMQVATELMRDRGLAPSEAARRVGYGSVAAFGRAYKRTVGVPPGAARRVLTA
ncbi:MAG TPA: AraC family transcriptional regulator [Solirubrobacteraceae bacterium]|nr:AraC family transcriptional regulator [Solirubrobacteraceae bacterium]